MTNLHHLLDRIAQPRLLVLGDWILDQYTWGDAERVSPEAPVLILRVDTREVRLGGAASVATLLRGLDAGVILAGVIGDDPEGRTLQSLLKDEGIDASQLMIVDKDRPTTTKERFVGRAANRHPHQILRVDEESRAPIDSNTEECLATAIASRLPTLALNREARPSAISVEAASCRSGPSPSSILDLPSSPVTAVLISDYGKGVCTPRLLEMVISFATERGVPIIIDPARIPDYDRYRYATLLKPNRAEAELAAGMSIRTPADALVAAAKLRRQHQVEAVLITLDRDGMVLVHGDDDGQHFPTQPRTVYDITGAGDMVLAALGLCLASGSSLPESVQVANAAAGLEVEKLGVAPVTREELSRALPLLGRGGQGGSHCLPGRSNNTNVLPSNPGADTPGSPPSRSSIIDPPSSSKITTLAALLPTLASYRATGKHITFTNGCFDLLHIGHVTMLEEAAALGDILIVAINSDSSVRDLKGPGRPVIPELDRARMLAALDCVDHVLIFDDPTPHNLLEQIRPDILVKGGTTPEIVGREIVESYRGRVVHVDQIPGISTTALLSFFPRLESESPTTLPPLGRGGPGGVALPANQLEQHERLPTAH